MKAMVLKKQGAIDTAPLSLEEWPIPDPKEDEVQIQIECAAICRTDLHVIEGDLPSEKLPLIPGHQIVGLVSKKGASATRFAIGQRIGVAWLRQTCGTCEFCQSSRENLCERPSFTGYHEDGGFAQFATVPEDYAYPIPDGLSPLTAVPLLCAGIIGYRALKRSELPDGGRLALFGFGSSAHLVIQIARHRGAQIYVITRGKKHQEMALELGAKWAGDQSRDCPAKVDSAILFAPAGELVPEALSLLKRGGTLALAGIHMSDIPALNYEKHLFYEKNIRSVTANTRQDGEELFQQALQTKLKPRVQTYSLEEANQALADLKGDKINGTGVLMIQHKRCD